MPIISLLIFIKSYLIAIRATSDRLSSKFELLLLSLFFSSFLIYLVIDINYFSIWFSGINPTFIDYNKYIILYFKGFLVISFYILPHKPFIPTDIFILYLKIVS